MGCAVRELFRFAGLRCVGPIRPVTPGCGDARAGEDHLLYTAARAVRGTEQLSQPWGAPRQIIDSLQTNVPNCGGQSPHFDGLRW